MYAGSKTYGAYVITGVNVREEIRTQAGAAARANVDISLQEVSPYQISTGIDITAEVITGKLTDKAEKAVQEKSKAADKAKDQENSATKAKCSRGKAPF